MSAELHQVPKRLAERVVVQAHGHLKIPAGVSPCAAAVTDPMATGLKGVLRSHIDVPAGKLVTGCGPVGRGRLVNARDGVRVSLQSEPIRGLAHDLRRNPGLEGRRCA